MTAVLLGEVNLMTTTYRRCLQFSLRTLFIVSLIVAAYFAGWATRQGEVDDLKAKAVRAHNQYLRLLTAAAATRIDEGMAADAWERKDAIQRRNERIFQELFPTEGR